MKRLLLAVLSASVAASFAQTAPAPKAIPADLVDKEGNYAPIPDPKDQDTIIKVQIYLDEHNFGPGKIDGALGEFGKKAASVYNQIHGHPVGNWHAILAGAEKLVPNPYTTYKITEEDAKVIVPGLPTKPKDQVKLKFLGYSSYVEFVAERFHTSEDFLAKINPKLRMGSLKPGAVVNVPNVTPFQIEKIKAQAAFKQDPALSARTVVINIADRVAVFFNEENQPFASFPITPGAERFIKFGEWKITNMVSYPPFRWDKNMLENGVRTKDESLVYNLPHGPNNPVGVLWAGTSRSGVGLHGTNSPHSIGRAESAGCIRFANWDAIRIPNLIRPDARVIVRL